MAGFFFTRNHYRNRLKASIGAISIIGVRARRRRGFFGNRGSTVAYRAVEIAYRGMACEIREALADGI